MNYRDIYRNSELTIRNYIRTLYAKKQLHEVDDSSNSNISMKSFYIILVVMLLSMAFARNIPIISVDTASHYSLVDKIDKDFIINKGYVEHLGEMVGYPPGAHYAAAFFNIFTNSGLVSMNIVNILTLALGWIIIANLVLETSIVSLFLMIGIVAYQGVNGLTLPLFGMEVINGNYLYGQFVATGYFIGLIYLVYKINISENKRILLSLIGFYLGLHIHASFAIGYFAGSVFYFFFLEYMDGIKSKFSIKKFVPIVIYGAVGSILFFTNYYTQFANALRRHNGSLGFDGFSKGAEDIAVFSYIFIYGCLLITVTSLYLYRFNEDFRKKFSTNFVVVNSFLMGISVIAVAQILLLQFEAVSPYVVKKNLFGLYTFFLVLLVIYMGVGFQYLLSKLSFPRINRSKVLLIILSPVLFILMASFYWSKSSTEIESTINAQKIARTYFNESKDGPSYRNTIAQFNGLSMPSNWLITLSDLEVYKWSPLSTVVVHQTPNDLPVSAFALTDIREDNVKDDGILHGQYRVYSSDAFKMPVMVESGKKISLTNANSNVIRYFGKGFSTPENWGTWSSEEEAELHFVIEKNVNRNVTVSLVTTAWVVKGRENFVATASSCGIKVAEREFNAPVPVEWKFDVPKNCINTNGMIAINFKFSNPVTPQSLGMGGDTRKVALGVQSLTVTYKDAIPVVDDSGKTILLTNANPDISRYLVKGFSTSENWGTWSSEEEAELHFAVEKTVTSKVTVNLITTAWVAKGREKFVATASSCGMQIAKREFNAPVPIEWKLDIPRKCIQKNGKIVVNFSFTNSVTPQSLGMGGDTRKVALGVESMTLNYK